jgi:integrase
MNGSAEIYNHKTTLNATLLRIKNSSLSEDNKSHILKFYRDIQAEGLSLGRIVKYLGTLYNLAKMLPKPFHAATKEDIIDLLQQIESKDYSDWTKRDYKIVIKRFYKWLRQTEDYPEEVRWIKARVKNKNLLPEQLLTEEEVKKLVASADNPRDKALILVLFESGCRIGELLTLRIRNVQFDEYGAQLIVNGKTGMRRVRIIASAPALATWLDNHPMRDDRDAPLWITMGTRDWGEILKYGSCRQMLAKLVKRAGLKKRVFHHLFRHSRATQLANSLSDSQLKQHLGWVQGSSMASVYIHLSGKEVDDALLRLQGLKKEERKEEPELKVVICSRCNGSNSPTSKFCIRCGLPLDIKTAVELDQTREKADALMALLLKNPKTLDALLAEVKKLTSKDAKKSKI